MRQANMTLGRNARRILILAFVLFGSVFTAFSATFYSRPDGTWSTTNGGANCGCTPGQNDIIIVNHNITLAGPFTLNTGTITVNAGVLTINGDLTFNNGSFVTVAQNAGIKVNGNFLNKNNSNDININGSLSVTGNFANGQGSGSGAIITVGPNGTISYGGSCNSPGTIIDSSGSHTGCNNGPLPVKLLYLKGENDGDYVSITWATATEVNTDHFELEHSADGKSFTTITTVAAAGNSETKQLYSYTDKAPYFGHNYYRLKSVDLDGYTEYYDLVIQVNSTTEQTFSVYPNPFHSGKLSVQIRQTPAIATTIRIKDLTGKTCYSQTAESLVTELTPGNLAPGLYVVEVSNTSEVYRERIVIE